MKLTTNIIKEELKSKLNGDSIKIKRLSKRKNESSQVVRIFEIMYSDKEITVIQGFPISCNRTEYFKVISNSSDEEIINIKKTSYEVLSSEERDLQKKKEEGIAKKLKGYIFCVSEVLEDRWDSRILYHTVVIERKSHWDKYQYFSDQSCSIMKYLPSYIEDMNETSEMAATKQDHMEIIKDLERLGLNYSNELAECVNEIGDSKMYIKP